MTFVILILAMRMATTWLKPMIVRELAAATPMTRSCPSKVALVCPSVCPSDWDKRKTLAAKDCGATTCGERQKKKRRGQDSNLRKTVKSSPV